MRLSTTCPDMSNKCLKSVPKRLRKQHLTFMIINTRRAELIRVCCGGERPSEAAIGVSATFFSILFLGEDHPATDHWWAQE